MHCPVIFTIRAAAAGIHRIRRAENSFVCVRCVGVYRSACVIKAVCCYNIIGCVQGPVISGIPIDRIAIIRLRNFQLAAGNAVRRLRNAGYLMILVGKVQRIAGFIVSNARQLILQPAVAAAHGIGSDYRLIIGDRNQLSVLIAKLICIPSIVRNAAKIVGNL